jgi:hypothetical protein
VIGQSKKNCYISVEGSKEFNLNLLSQISKSLISQYFKPIRDIPPGGVSIDSCVYEITVTKEGDTTFVVFSGEDLNSYGDSKLYGSDGFQQSLLKSLYRSLRDKRKLICDDYGTLLEECVEVVVKDVPKKVEPKVVEKKVTIPKGEPKVVVEKKVQENIVLVEKNGKGVLYYRKVNGESGWYKNGDDKKDGKYVGEIGNKVPNGQGNMTSPNGRKYLGKWKDGKRNGQGTSTNPNGRKYVGDWKDGSQWNGNGYDRNGYLKIKYVNGKRIRP